MISLNFDSSPETNENQPATTPLKVPRLDSLHHRLQHARDADGQPIPLLNELLFFLDDPPPGAVSNNKNTLTESTKKSATSASSLPGRNSFEMSSSYHPIPPHNGISPCPPTDGILSRCPRLATSSHPITEYHHPPPPPVVSIPHFQFDHREDASSHSAARGDGLHIGKASQ